MTKEMGKNRLSTFRTCMFALLCIVMLVFGIRFTVAAFTANDFLKAVATTNQNDSLFASDVLVGYTTVPESNVLEQSRQSLTVPSKDGTASFSFDVRNCLKDNREVVNPKDVEYTVTVEVQGENLSDLSSYSVSGFLTSATRDGNTFKFDKRLLRGNNAMVDTFTVVFPENDIGKASFVVKAVHSGGSGTSLWGLAAKLVTSQAVSVDSLSVSGKLVLNTVEGSTNDAYNYQITVAGKPTDVTITWPNDKVEIEPFFGKKYKYKDKDAIPGNGTVTFHLEPGVTTINFYQKDGATIVDGEITCAPVQ